MTKKELTIIEVDVNELQAADYNPRSWGVKAIADLKASIRTFGLVDPIIVNKNSKRKNIVIGGHFRLYVAKEMGYEKVPVVYIDIPSIDKEKELNLRLNKNSGDWDFLLLRSFEEGLLKEIGFDSKDLDRIFKAKSAKSADDAPDLRGKTKIKKGDIFKLGDHKLMCGDATLDDHMNALMGKDKADLIFTDPPYNVNYSGKGKNTSNTIKNDNQTEENFRAFLKSIFCSYKEYSKETAALYTCYAARTHREFEDALNANGYVVKNQIIWVKTVASMGWGDYRWKHEPILYCKQSHAKKTPFYGDHMQYTEWREELSDEELLKKIKAMITKEEAGASTVWKLSRETEYKHPTQKPVKLIAIAVYNSSQRGDLVLDLFGGSGSTLMTCEQLGRRCNTMELDPLYCQVIIDRWEEYTGKKALKIQ